MQLQILAGTVATIPKPLASREITDPAQWKDWKWQQRNAVRSVDQLLQTFPGIPPQTVSTIKRNLAMRRIQITPYTLDLIRRTPEGDTPLPEDPIWRQLVPIWTDEQTSAYQ